MMDDAGRGEALVRTIAMLGNHLPRQCGIATFTTDLSQDIANEMPELDCFVLAMNDPGVHHAYPPRVRFEIAEGDVAAYRRAADFLNVNAVDVLSVQHEYRIFGAKAGANVLELLRELRMPVVSTLHTIIAAPNPVQRTVMDSLIALSERVVVMSSNGAALLHDVHGVDVGKIDVIPHGIPMAPERRSKDRLGVEGRSVILTFGLLSPEKGVEYVIDAIPSILERTRTRSTSSSAPRTRTSSSGTGRSTGTCSRAVRSASASVRTSSSTIGSSATKSWSSFSVPPTST